MANALEQLQRFPFALAAKALERSPRGSNA
jgi:hypothetical protein